MPMSRCGQKYDYDEPNLLQVTDLVEYDNHLNSPTMDPPKDTDVVDSKDVVHIQTTSASKTEPQDRHGRHSRVASLSDDMPTIPESEEVAFHDPSDAQTGETSLLHEQESSQSRESPSLFRKITTKFASSSIRTPAIPMGPLRSIRRQKGSEYANLESNDDGEADVSVDLSSLSGLGFQLTEPAPPSSQPWLDQDTSYQSPQSATPKPDFRSFVRRRQVGDGLVVGASLQRDPSAASSVSRGSSRAQEIQRTKTARHAAQNIAKERNMIVAVSESVDLSFLEGQFVPSRMSRSFDTMLNGRGSSVENDPKSYFFPRDPNIPDWRPITMSKTFIAFLALLAFALAGSQEFLCQKSQQRQQDKKGLLSFDEVAKVSVWAFFVWKYLPTMVTIIYAVLFASMDFDIRRLEPYYQLSQPTGSPASSSLNVDLLTMFQYFVPFKAMRLKQWTVFCSTIGNIIASTVSPALQNPSVNFTANPSCNSTNANYIQCPDVMTKKYVVLIDPVWSRLLSASYLVVGMICVIILILLRRKSGLLSDPKGIAGIASMATKSHILHDFRGTDLATMKDIQKRLAHRHYILYQSSIWQGEWNANSAAPSEIDQKLSSPHPPMLRLAAGIPFISAQVFCLVAVPLISLTPANVVPNAAPWLPILIATLLKLVWSTFEADVRMMEPFYQLSLGNQPPENSLTLDYQATLYGFMPFKAAYNGHWLLCLVGICSVALDVLSVTVSSFSIQANRFFQKGPPDDQQGPATGVGDQTRVSFWTSVILSLVILTYSILVTILIYLRRRHPFLPREPSTIAAVLAFIYASNMLDDFFDTERLSNKEMEKRLKGLGKSYSLGWFKGRDGQVHCAIDQEPMRSKYVHGKPYHQALAGPLDHQDAFYA